MSIYAMNLPNQKIMETTANTILGGKVEILQPTEGYRASIDPIFLAASVQTDSTETVLDMGTGVGTAMLALAHRVKDIRITGLEFQRELVRLTGQNIKLNGFHDRLEVIHGDLLTPPPRLAASSFSQVIANPPYFESNTSVPSPRDNKALSNHDQGISLEKWVSFAHRMVKPKGFVTFVFTADRLDDLLAAFYGRFGDITLFPLWPKDGRKAKRLIVRGRKNVKSPSKILNGLIVHQEDGSYTEKANRILNGITGLNLD